MKRSIFLAFVMSLFLSSATACSVFDDDKPITINELPSAAVNFVQQHFVGVEISYAKMDRELGGYDYEVVLSDGTSLEFDSNGQWTSIDGERAELPSSVVPAEIAAYVQQKYSHAYIEKISRSKRYYEVELNNDLELIFDKAYNFIRVDD